MRFTKIIAPVAISLAIVSASAGASDAVSSITVDVRDLDLSQPADQSVLDQRIDRAARSICRSGVLGLTGRRLDEECRQQALANAKPDADHAIAMAKTGVSGLAVMTVTPASAPNA